MFLIVRDHGKHFFSRGTNLSDAKFKRDKFWGFVKNELSDLDISMFLQCNGPGLYIRP